MRRRSIPDIAPLSMHLVVSIAISPHQAARLLGYSSASGFRVANLMQRLLDEARTDPVLERNLHRALDHALGALPIRNRCIAEQTAILRIAHLAQDGLTMAQVLWSATHQQGLAWRTFEMRTATALRHLAFRQIANQPALAQASVAS
jgi:hypothetical protein